MERWAYEDVLAFAQSWGSVYFTLLFVVVVIYALWPKNRAKFESASQIPFKEDDTP